MQNLIVILPVMWVAVIVVYIYYGLLPVNKTIAVKRTELQEIIKQYEEAARSAAKLSIVQQEIQILNHKIQEIEKILPKDAGLPNLIRELTKTMSEHNILWDRLAPSNPSEKDYYREHSYTIPFKSSYHDLAVFLTKVGQNERLFATRYINLGQVKVEKNDTITITGELTFLFYTSKG